MDTPIFASAGLALPGPLQALGGRGGMIVPARPKEKSRSELRPGGAQRTSCPQTTADKEDSPQFWLWTHPLSPLTGALFSFRALRGHVLERSFPPPPSLLRLHLAAQRGDAGGSVL